jgi:hypothetical protein
VKAEPRPGRWRAETALTTRQAVRALEEGELEVEGRLVDASNATLYCALRPPPGLLTGRRRGALHAIYKPVRGERPLADFPEGSLAAREVAAWLVSEATGWRVVPPTVLRDGPFGEGMVQLWIEVDETVGILGLILTRDQRLRRMALFDVVANNADRKGGHVLPTLDGELHGCDHGICFSAEPKLRTVLWGWAGEPLRPEERQALELLQAALGADLDERLAALLDADEREALADRLARLLREGRFPRPDPDRRVIPWPPF